MRVVVLAFLVFAVVLLLTYEQFNHVVLRTAHKGENLALETKAQTTGQLNNVVWPTNRSSLRHMATVVVLSIPTHHYAHPRAQAIHSQAQRDHESLQRHHQFRVVDVFDTPLEEVLSFLSYHFVSTQSREAPIILEK